MNSNIFGINFEDKPEESTKILDNNYLTIKEVEKNEKETVIVQRRAIRMKSSKSKGSLLTAQDVEVLRPCPSDALEPWQLDLVLGKALTRDLVSGEHLTLDAIE